MKEPPGNLASIVDKTHPNPPSAAPTGIERLLRPFQALLHAEASGGVLLLGATSLALAWANSPWASGYFALWHYSLTIGIEHLSLTKSLHHWINDGLMAVFFFMVGLEIKREFLVGELASARKAALPIAGALGGMLLPAGIYLLGNFGGEGSRGWGIPMATDIAFAMGMLALLGDRVPAGLKVFLTALAIADDIGAVLVIALFYTDNISLVALGAGGAFLVGLITMNLLGVRRPLPYLLLGLGLWAAFLESGIHATIAGVLAAMTVPARTRLDPAAFLKDARNILRAFEAEGDAHILHSGRRQAAVTTLEAACEHVQSPMQRLEHSLLPWVKVFIMPVFALANAGVALDAQFVAAFGDPITLGIIGGLVLGKPLGITLAAWLAIKANLAELPERVGWAQLAGAGILAGIGFTMSLFIANLAFGGTPRLALSKAGILTASLIAGLSGCGALWWGSRPAAKR
ncbi:MAG: Na+/H+ antiporter NhaA [Verrucomicrobia bacterium]|nr:Na+/H+ antiporter NhaA [Verrucomicrobiota bacterium]